MLGINHILLHFDIYNVAREGEELLQVALRSLQRNITDLNRGHLEIKGYNKTKLISLLKQQIFA
jgi:hypothetical protein